MIILEERSGGVLIPVQAQPKARRREVIGEHAGRLKVAVTAPPDKGKANEALVEVLADALGVKRGQVELVTGATSPAKTFLVKGIARDELSRRIASLLGSGSEGG